MIMPDDEKPRGFLMPTLALAACLLLYDTTKLANVTKAHLAGRFTKDR